MSLHPFIDVPPQWQTKHTVVVTSFLYHAHLYTVSTIDLATTQNYELLQALAQVRDELKPGAFLPAKRYETRAFMDGEDAYMLKSIYDTQEEAETGHQQCVALFKNMLIARDKEVAE